MAPKEGDCMKKSSGISRRRFFDFGVKASFAIGAVSAGIIPIAFKMNAPLTGTLELARRTLPALAGRASIYTSKGWRYIVTRTTIQAGPHRGQRGIAAWYTNSQGEIRHFVEGLR